MAVVNEAIVSAAQVPTLLLQPNGFRTEFIIESKAGSSDMYVNYGLTAGTLSAYTTILTAGDTLSDTEYPGAVYAIWVAPGVGSASVTEVANA